MRYITISNTSGTFVFDTKKCRGSEAYSRSDATQLSIWLNERAAGYPARELEPLQEWQL